MLITIARNTNTINSLNKLFELKGIRNEKFTNIQQKIPQRASFIVRKKTLLK